VLAVVAIGAAAFGYVSTQRAKQAELEAHKTRAIAEQARGEAEKLIVYLLDDFYLELEPVGRLDIVAELSKRALNYYDTLPAELRSPETDRNRALALVRYGAALRNQSKLDESQKALVEAVDVLGRLRKGGDTSETTTIGLGLGLTSQARVADSQTRREGRDLAKRAVDVLQPLMQAPSPSIAARRAYGFAMTYLGFTQQRDNDEEQAVKTLEAARAAYRGIGSLDGPKLDDLPAAVAYAEASAWQMSALQSLGRFDEVRNVGEDALRVTGQVLDQRPGNMSALRARGLIGGALESVEGQSLHIRKALALAEQERRDWEAIVKLDPTNQIAWNNLVGTRVSEGFWLLGMGDIREALKRWHAGLALEKNVRESGMIGSVLSLSAGYITKLEADSGNRQAADAALKTNRRYAEMAISRVAPDSFGHTYIPEFLTYYGYPTTGFGYGAYAIPYSDEDYETLRKEARASVRRLEQITNANASQALDRSRVLEVAYRTAALASYHLRDYAAADAEIKHALEIHKAIPTRVLFEEIDAADQVVLAATIAARLDRRDEAQRMLEPVLKLHRSLYVRKDNEWLGQRVLMASALYASALAGNGNEQATLSEAARLIDTLPDELRQLKSTALVRREIAQEQQRRRG
jgi:tetratricopeptide (TPR) repeat protein